MPVAQRAEEMAHLGEQARQPVGLLDAFDDELTGQRVGGRVGGGVRASHAAVDRTEGAGAESALCGVRRDQPPQVKRIVDGRAQQEQVAQVEARHRHDDCVKVHGQRVARDVHTAEGAVPDAPRVLDAPEVARADAAAATMVVVLEVLDDDRMALGPPRLCGPEVLGAQDTHGVALKEARQLIPLPR